MNSCTQIETGVERSYNDVFERIDHLCNVIESQRRQLDERDELITALREQAEILQKRIEDRTSLYVGKLTSTRCEDIGRSPKSECRDTQRY